MIRRLLTCYYCQSESESSTCLIADSHNTTGCTKKYCTIYRQELIDPPGKLISFSRSCQDNPLYLNAIIYSFDEGYKKYYRSCRKNFCNKGNGLEKITDNIIASSSNSTITIVPGIGNCGQQLSQTINILIFIFILSLTKIIY
ncbi:hypothetical protein HCN44_010432 [Aphidius gifuensis]|uniref:Uncharacterized protein n=1 Tax=Aphidius gifuensis TaxID=684658 RepID=A0A834XRS7_APHGI|nr:hypothetical protein HCN44_010432 [Aphidius gifuensis]